MAKKLFEESNIQAIANAIRGKCGTTCGYKTCDMAEAIESITTGSGDGNITLRLDLLADYTYFPKVSRAIVQLMGSEGILTLDAETLDYSMFVYCFQGLCGMAFDASDVLDFSRVQLSSRLIQLLQNSTGGFYTHSMFSGGTTGGNYGNVILPSWMTYLKPAGCGYMFQNSYLDTIPEFDTTYMGTTQAGYSRWYNSYMFKGSTISTIPTSITKAMKYQVDPNAGSSTYAYGSDHFYAHAFEDCCALTKVESLGVDTVFLDNVSSNLFINTFNKCTSLTSLTFEMNDDGTPITASNWTNQTITLTSTSSVYNHDSMVETINSLPDVSGSGGTNTIKFTNSNGGSELTEEEIAVATARGWTITLA